MSNYNLLGISGFARSGKDSLAKNIKAQLERDGYVPKIYSLAHALKKDLEQFLAEKCGLDVWTDDTRTKAKFRPLLVAYGKIQRERSAGTYWTSIIQKEMEKDASEHTNGEFVSILADVRYASYPDTDEVFWLKKLGGYLINVNRISEDGLRVAPANNDEEENSIIIERLADYNLTWDSYRNVPEGFFEGPLLDAVKPLYSDILKWPDRT